ncbi:MAG: hydrolase [Geminicoccaceae bacterium]|jgi:8-oxo-dGTP pyrophosphatase MutT (NUDIX family)|nr:hydrolase [Geminicoccaceae bacterium]
MPRGDEPADSPGNTFGLVEHPTLRRLARALEDRPGALAPDDGAPRRAAVAVVFRRTDDDVLELLLIKRSERQGDPWSGHVALPGGRHEPGDATLQDTAVRETLEETGIDIARDGVVLGTLDELRPRTPVLPPIIVTPFVAVVPATVSILPSDEVADSFWVPLVSLADPGIAVESDVISRGATWRVPAYRLGAHIVWGMTERILRNLLSLIEPPSAR